MENLHSLLALMVVIWITGKIFRSFKLPVIFGELLGGIIVGPLVLNIADTQNTTITVLSELGIFFLMLHTGLETNPKELFKATKRALIISIISIIVPFAALFGISRFFGYSTNQSLLLAVALSITAIAVTARVLKDYKIHKTKTANTIMGAAIINDILGLMLFSIILDIADTGSIQIMPLLFMIAKLLIFFWVIIWGGMRISKYLKHILKDKGFTFSLIAAFALGTLAEFIGLHMVIGAFLAGLFIREEVIEKKIFHKIEDRIYGLSYSFLGPIFFASLAFNLDLNIIRNHPTMLITIFMIAIIGKFLGSAIPAFLQIKKTTIRESALIGMAMNHRGAVDLAIASIGLTTGIIDKEIFSILILLTFTMTLCSVFATKAFAKYAQ